ncbi:Ig domain-containing protein [Paracoccus sp. NFXS7]|uniref:Ig domain-containing protein n=1 Tax=Paracoccus sp. NFXS7 TaxID=2908653 RepID=UPI0032DE3AE9
MANIIKTSVGGAGARPVTEIVLTATNDLTYEPGAGHVLILRNPTAASIDCVLRGADSTTVNFPGAPFISVAGGYSTPVPAGAVRAIPLDTVAAYLKGPVTVTGAGLVAVLMRAVNGRGARSIFNDPPAAMPGEIVIPTAPAAFATGDWSVATGPAPNQVVITINNLPSDGGSPITALQYSNGGTWTNLSGTGAGQYVLDMPAAGTEYPIRIRTRNAIGISGPGVTKTVLSGVADAAPAVIGGASIGQAGASGTIYNGYVLADGDDFDDMTAADFLTPTSAAGAYMTTRHYGIQSTAPRYLRGAASLGGYEADPWHTGFLDANRGVVPASYADMITFENGILRAKSRRATTAERALMGALNGKLNLSSMIHMGRRNMMRAPCLMEMRLRFPSELSSWNQWHPTFWLIQSQPGNGWDGLELDCEGFSPALQFNRNTWNNGVGSYGPTLGNTAPVSETEFRDYAFEILQVGGVWRVRLWENGSLVAEGSPDYGGNAFDPSRPFHLMMTNHILQSGINQAIFDAAGDAGADIECDWWRAWRPSTGTFRQPLVPAAVLETPFNTAFSFALPTPQQVWGSDVTADVIEMIPNEDNTPAQPWVRGLLPPSVTRTGNTLAGTIGDNPGQLVLARSATPALGDGCVPQPITIAVGPVVRWSGTTVTEGQPISADLYALCDCGDLHMGKTVTVTGLAGSGLTYNAVTGLLTGTPPLGSYTPTITVTNSRGQTASRTVTITAAAAGSGPAYASWAGPGWFDASDDSTLTLSGAEVTALANKRAGGGNLAGAGVAGTKNRVADAQNGRAIIRVTRDTSGSGTRPRFEALPTDAISQMFQGNDRPYTVITAYRPTDTNTGYIWSASENANGDASSEQIALIRRNTTASSVRRQLLEGTTNDVSWGTGQASGAARIVAIKHTGTAVTVWDNQLAKTVDAAAQDVTAFSTDLAFYLFASRTVNASSYSSAQCNLDFYEIVIENTARSDAEIVQALQDIATKWGITLS